MTEKRYKAIPETGEYKDTITGEFLSPKFEEGFYKVLDLLNENDELKSDIKYFETTYEIEESGLDIVPEMCTITSSTPSRKELFKENEQLKSTNMEYEDALGRLEEENEILKEIIKFRYDMEICETCKHGYYWITNDFFGKEGNFKCLKGHPADECMEIKECKDYEIEDLNEMLERVKND